MLASSWVQASRRKAARAWAGPFRNDKTIQPSLQCSVQEDKVSNMAEDYMASLSYDGVDCGVESVAAIRSVCIVCIHYIYQIGQCCGVHYKTGSKF